MSRIRRGFKLAGVSWRVVVAEPAILVVVFVGLIGMVLTSGVLFLLVFRRWPEGNDFEFPNSLIALPVLWAGTIVSSYCNVIVTVMADRRLRGEDPTVDDGIAVATAKLGRIVSWTLVSMVVGLVISTIAERFKLGGVIAARLLDLGWALATTFVVPILALEDLRVRDTIKRSAEVFKAKWGESVVAQGTIGLAVTIVALPAILIAAGFFLLSPLAGIVAMVCILSLVMLVSGALDSVVRVALYRYAVDGEVLGAFTVSDLQASYRRKT
jgi:hypothetical protein